MSNDAIQSLTLMFVDIVSLQKVRTDEGEGEARSFLKQCVDLIKEVCTQNEGQLIRTVGGTILCSFEDADNALRAATAMHERIGSASFNVKTQPFLRMGLHAGMVELRDGSCRGDVVTTTARMVTLAQPGQTIATGDVREQASPGLAEEFSAMPNAESMEERLHVSLYQVGKSLLPQSSVEEGTSLQEDSKKRETSPVSAFQKQSVEGQERTSQFERNSFREAVSPNKPSERRRRPIVLQEMHKKQVAGGRPETVIAEHPRAAANVVENPDNIQLCLIWHDHVVSVCSEKTVVTLGRGGDNDIILTVKTSSRRHAEIQMRGGKFFLVDSSGNGTFVYDEQGSEHYVEQGEVELSGSGALCPGCPQEEVGCEALLFWIAGR